LLKRTELDCNLDLQDGYFVNLQKRFLAAIRLAFLRDMSTKIVVRDRIVPRWDLLAESTSDASKQATDRVVLCFARCADLDCWVPAGPRCHPLEVAADV
jgi:hypothetical protein